MLGSSLWWLVLGLLIGWLIEWVVDWVYWRRRWAKLAAELDGAKADASRLSDENARLRAQLDAPGTARGAATLAPVAATAEGVEATHLQAELDDMRARLARLRGLVRDPLIDINGIGPVYEQKLFDAGVYTFADLAAQTPERVREIVGPEEWQKIDAAAWIAEARTLARERYPDLLIDINGIGPVYEQKLFDAGVYTFEQLAELTPEQVQAIIKPERWQDVDTAAWIAEARTRAGQLADRTEDDRLAIYLASLTKVRGENSRLRAEVGTARTGVDGAQTLVVDQGESSQLRAEVTSLRAALRTLKAKYRDPLIDIDGIGPVYEQKLFDAGVYTFADLAAQTPERVREIVGPEEWQKIDAAAWIAEARTLQHKAHPDPLIDIDGIGPVYEQKLFDASVYTFEQLAELTPEQVQAIIKPERWQDIAAAAWIAEARTRVAAIRGVSSEGV